MDIEKLNDLKVKLTDEEKKIVSQNEDGEFEETIYKRVNLVEKNELGHERELVFMDNNNKEHGGFFVEVDKKIVDGL